MMTDTAYVEDATVRDTLRINTEGGTRTSCIQEKRKIRADPGVSWNMRFLEYLTIKLTVQ